MGMKPNFVQINCYRFIRQMQIYSTLLTITICVFTLGASCANAQEPVTSVWAWKITDEKRVVYLLGEIHSFAGESLNISHDLGLGIAQNSSEIWTENQQSHLLQQKYHPKLSTIIKPSTHKKVVQAIRNAIDLSSDKSFSDKERLLSEFMSVFDANDPFAAYVTFENIASLKLFREKPEYKIYDGFSAHLRKSNDAVHKNIVDIEAPTASADMWWENCNFPVKADAIVRAAVEKISLNEFELNKLIEENQTAFFKKDTNLSELSDVLFKSKESALLKECNINPRNRNWLPKIVKALSTDGPPVTFIVGVGHIGGDGGLIKLLKKQGFNKIKRIYSVD